MNILCVLYVTFWIFISTVTRVDYHNYIYKVSNESQNIYIAVARYLVQAMYFAEITEIFK